jgi:molecular chaperone Hsp33
MSDERDEDSAKTQAGDEAVKDGYIQLSTEIEDDVVVPFQAERAGARGRLIRLGEAVNKILTGHDYPDAVANFLGEAIALTAIIGSSLKFKGKLILQTKTDGPISMMVVDYSTPGHIRAYASYDKALVAQNEGLPLDMQSWLGQGYMALTVDQGAEMERYQGVVALHGHSLGEAAEDYFQQSEQIPSLVRLHVAKHYNSVPVDGEHWHWRAGGLMVQYLTAEGGVHSVVDAPGDGVEEFDEDDNWRRARILGESVEAHELLDPELAPERLLFRLYHEEGVRVFDKHNLKAQCTCSSERVKAMLQNFSADERHKMVEETGKITVTCEFCNDVYSFGEEEFKAE